MEIKKIKKISFANVLALLFAVFGFIATLGMFVYLLSKIIFEEETAGKLVSFIFINLGVDFLISLAAAVALGIIGWFIGIIVAAVYNFLAKEIGGVKIETIDEASEIEKIIIEETKQEIFKY